MGATATGFAFSSTISVLSTETTAAAGAMARAPTWARHQRNSWCRDSCRRFSAVRLFPTLATNTRPMGWAGCQPTTGKTTSTHTAVRTTTVTHAATTVSTTVEVTVVMTSMICDHTQLSFVWL